MGNELLKCLAPTGRCAVNVLMYLALHGKQGPVTVAELSEQIHYSVSYLERILAILSSGGIVTGMRGHHGGYGLRHPPVAVTVADIILAVGKLDKAKSAGAAAGDEPPATTEARLIAEQFLQDLDKRTMDYLASISLQDLIDKSFASRSF